MKTSMMAKSEYLFLPTNQTTSKQNKKIASQFLLFVLAGRVTVGVTDYTNPKSLRPNTQKIKGYGIAHKG